MTQLQTNFPSRRRKFATFRTIWALMLREMSTTYGKSSIGYLWAVLEPAAGVFLLTWIFSQAFSSPPLGTNFALFYATGFVPFSAYMAMSSKLTASLRFSKSLLMYPTVTIVDALLARYLLNVITQIAVGAVVFGGIIYGYDLSVIVNYQALALGILYTMAFSLGIGMINCFLLTSYDTWDRVWSIITRPLFIVSCIFFVFDGVSLPYRDYLWWNPLIHSVGQFRAAFYPTYDAEYTSSIYIFLFSGILTVMGLALLIKHYKDMMSRL